MGVFARQQFVLTALVVQVHHTVALQQANAAYAACAMTACGQMFKDCCSHQLVYIVNVTCKALLPVSFARAKAGLLCCVTELTLLKSLEPKKAFEGKGCSTEIAVLQGKGCI